MPSGRGGAWPRTTEATSTTRMTNQPVGCATVEDLAGVAAWMTEQGLGDGPLENVAPISGGTQNIMQRFERSGRPYVFRRGPAHLRPVSNKVILRETQVLAALADTDVPHPRLIAVCEDTAVLGDAVFYLMEPVDGFNAGEGLPEPHASDRAIQFGMGVSMADALARLGAVDHVAVGLSGYGKPDGFLERQVPRWLSELDGYSAFPNYPGPDIGDVRGVAAWLDENRPARWTPGIMHGDYHGANVMFSRTGPELAAIVDWELASVGDPLVDLGWVVATWPDPTGPVQGTVGAEPWTGFPTAAELVEHYGRRSARDLSRIRWYVVLACFRLGMAPRYSIVRGQIARTAQPRTDR